MTLISVLKKTHKKLHMHNNLLRTMTHLSCFENVITVKIKKKDFIKISFFRQIVFYFNAPGIYAENKNKTVFLNIINDMFSKFGIYSDLQDQTQTNINKNRDNW